MTEEEAICGEMRGLAQQCEDAAHGVYSEFTSRDRRQNNCDVSRLFFLVIENHFAE